jgi:integrase
MLASGVKLQVVSEVLGHASIRMTADVYGHILAPDREAAANAMDQALWSGA